MTHPYRSLPPHTRWSLAVASKKMGEVDPIVGFPFRIALTDRVSTAGSCFAQHIARHLKDSGYNYYVTEDGHPLAPDALKAEFNYGVFSARYANIYTSRQLIQLFQRAYGTFIPHENVWTYQSRCLDPLRPQIQKNGFATIQELTTDRTAHLKAVRKMFENLDYFVFTLGLTECWRDRRDGTVLPLCPGVAGGAFDPEKYEFVNLNVADVVADMCAFEASLRSVNPKAKIILTVSPVPLAATADSKSHVLTSTTYSKSVLRVACEELTKKYPQTIAYFPSYEIVTGAYTRTSYFDDDLRSVTDSGVEHVMRLFFKHATQDGAAPDTYRPSAAPDDFIERMKSVTQTLCEEELIERSMN